MADMVKVYLSFDGQHYVLRETSLRFIIRTLVTNCTPLVSALLSLCELVRPSVRLLPVNENPHDALTVSDIWIKIFILIYLYIF